MSNISFQDGSMWSTSKLDIVNECLSAIGETQYADGTVLDSLQFGTDGQIASKIVTNVMVEVQQRGWYFNMDYNMQLVPDVNGFISMPPNTLRVDFGNGPDRHKYVLKRGKVYDVHNQTYLINKVVEADVVWLVDYNDLPPEAYEYIAARAARKAQQKMIGSKELDKFTARDEVDALNNLMRVQLQSQDYSLRNNRVSTRIHNGWLIKGLYGNTNRREF